MGEHLREQSRKRWTRFEQPEQIDPARQPLDDVAEPVERALRVGTGRDRAQSAGSIASNACCAAGERSERALPERHCATCRAAPSGSANPRPEIRYAGYPDRSTGAHARHAPGCRRSRRRARLAEHQFEQVGAGREAVQMRDIVERIGIARKEVGLRILYHLHPVFDRPQHPVSVGEIIGSGRSSRPAASNAAVASSVAGRRTDGSRPPWIICWIWTKNSTSRIPPRPRLRS